MDGYSGAWEILMHEERKRRVPKLIDYFESRGVDYAKGFLAGLQGRKPLWLLRLMRRLGVSQGPYFMEEAAQAMLQRHGIDPLMCGAELYA